MDYDIKTLELARIYESQGYFRTAYKIYAFLDKQKSSNEIRAGLKRCDKKMTLDQPLDDNAIHAQPVPEKKISALLEKWLMLMVLQRRLSTYKKIKARLI